MRRFPLAAALFLAAMLVYVAKSKADNPHLETIDFPGAGFKAST